MNFELSEEEAMVRDTARRFVDADVRAQASQWDGARALPRSVLDKLTELGFSGVLVPDSANGAGLGLRSAVLVLEALAEGDGSLALFQHHQSIASVWPFLAHGQTETAARIVSRGLCPAAVFEGVSGCAAEDGLFQTVCKDRHVSGRKNLVPFASDSSAFVVFSRSPDGLIIGLVEAAEAKVENTGSLGFRAAQLSRVEFESAVLSEVIEIEGQDLKVFLAVFGLGLSAISVGLGSAALSRARDYALERKQFGQPISDFQAIQWKLSNGATELDAARLLVLAAADALDRNQSDALRKSFSARAFSASAARRAAEDAIQIHGGNGLVAEYQIERLYRDTQSLASWFDGAESARSKAAGELLTRSS